MQYLVEKVELSKDKEQLIFHTRSVSDCNRLHSQLYGQLLDITEGRKSIRYDIQEDIPDDATLDILGDADQLLKVLTYLEVELKFYKYLAPGTTEQIQDLLKDNQLSTARHEDDALHQEAIAIEHKYSPK